MRQFISALLVSMIGSALLHAETLVIPVVGQGWRIKFEGPVLAVESQHFDADGLIYRGNAGRFNVSAYVENQPKGGGESKACRDYFWQKAAQNPMVQKDSVKQWSAPLCECVEYVTVDESLGEKQTLANINCCFEMLGKWVDVHASVIAPTDEDTRMLKKLGESLIYCTFARPKSEPQEFEMGAMGRLRFVVPAAWQLGNHCVTTGIGTAEQHTLALFSPTDPNKTWKMTFFNSSMHYKTQKDIEMTAQTVQQAAAARSVEGAAKMEAIKLKQGVGCQAVFTDAALAEKPVEPGNAKVICTGLVAPQPDVLGTVTVFADDGKDADFLAAIQALGSIEWMAEKKSE
ncbi:hypothetical protein [Prosthecobacter sp.]|uniref:hypothetical protein n=1 Tax=Prosthecobacter sp. TaxID=1965333 RepID=UPI003783DA57